MKQKDKKGTGKVPQGFFFEGCDDKVSRIQEIARVRFSSIKL